MPKTKKSRLCRFTPDDEKLRELILFICERSEDDMRFGATKLNKILFYSDFLAYLKFGKPITGHTYQALEHGPAPKALVPILRKMEAADEVATKERDHHGKKQKVTVALRSADPSLFTAEEIALVTEVIEQCWKTNAKQLSGLSHQFLGWQAARLQEEIPYQTALVESEIELTRTMLQRGKSLESVAKKCLARSAS